MTTNYHTAISVGAAANAATFNTPLGALDEAITNAQTGVFNVLEYGAVGNGVTDDTTAIQNAINAASAITPAGRVIFPRGLYAISDPLTISTDGVALIGNAGFSRSTILCTTADSGIVVDKGGGSVTYQVDIRDIYINGNSVSTTGLKLVNANECNFRDLIFINSVTNSILIQGAYCGLNNFDHILSNGPTNTVKVEGGVTQWFHNCNFYGDENIFMFTGSTTDIQILSCWFENFDTVLLFDHTSSTNIYACVHMRDCYFLSVKGGGTYTTRIIKVFTDNATYSGQYRDIQMIGCKIATSAAKYVMEVDCGGNIGGGSTRIQAVLRDNIFSGSNMTAWFASDIDETSYEYVRVLIDNPMYEVPAIPLQDGAQFGLWQGFGCGGGAIVSGKCWAVEGGDSIYHKTVLRFTLTSANDIDLADGADHGAGVKVYDFPAGRILILGAVIDGYVTCNDAFNADPNDVFYLACGSATAADDADLTSTEADIIPKTTFDTVGNTVAAFDWHSQLATSAQFDGTSSALDLYVNAAVADASTTKAVTIAVTGTITITWANLGDY